MAPAAEEPEHGVRAEGDPAADSDGELLCRISERDHEVFEILYRRYAASVYGLALRRLSDRGRAEEATQQVFAAVWRSAPTYDPERGGGADWLFTVARNTIVDHALTGLEAAAQDGRLAFQVHAAVAELPEPERVPLELAYWGGRSQSEIAEFLDLPLALVETRTRSALARLAVRLEGS
jgi:RNA polymerase sigma-70 factor (ECF subfamily)